MTSPARENILSRLRTAMGDESPAPESVCMPIDAKGRQEKIEKLKSLLEAVKGEVHVVRRAEWIDRLKAVARERGLKTLVYAPDTWVGEAVSSAWAEGGNGLPAPVAYTAPVEDWKEALFKTDAAVTTTRGAIAEIGAIVLWPDEVEPRLMSLVPPVHIAVLEAEAIHNTFCEIIQTQKWADGMPTNALLISGPSKTADIEMTLAYGVHGPKALVVIIIDG